jgi:hypothetical protein
MILQNGPDWKLFGARFSPYRVWIFPDPARKRHQKGQGGPLIYLCKYCGIISNSPLSGYCEVSPTEEHKCVSGEKVEDHVQMEWERTPEDLTNVTG